ncbi:hypothetical protein OAO01_00690 [Oligoflexia bacterium]|nr:hypothetical protein [Oligoflexia bacterium]
MDCTKAIDIIRKLIDGVDPLTGEAFPKDSPYNRPTIIRALLTVVEHATQPNRKKSVEERRSENVAKGLPRNSGLPWNEEARAVVAKDFKQGMTVEKLAEAQARSRLAIVAELKRQGVISSDEASEMGLVISR